MMGELITEMPVLPAHRALLRKLLSCQPFQDAVHVEAMSALTSHYIHEMLHYTVVLCNCP